jgi:hypothetical protein
MSINLSKTEILKRRTLERKTKTNRGSTETPPDSSEDNYSPVTPITTVFDAENSEPRSISPPPEEDTEHGSTSHREGELYREKTTLDFSWKIQQRSLEVDTNL